MVTIVSSIVLTLDSDQEIITEYVASGSQRAATAFVRKYQKFVYSTALRYLKSFEDADDVAQEVFIKALNNIESFRFNSSLKTWLYRITINICSNYRRKKTIYSLFSHYDKQEILEDFTDNLTPDKSLENKEFERQFLDILSNLPKKQRETFALRYFDNLSYEEISKMLGTTVGGLKANYFQAVKKLAEHFKNIKA